MQAWQMAEPVSFRLSEGEHIAIVGPNGGGKSMLVDIVRGAHPLIGDAAHYDFSPSTRPLASDNIKYISFRDSYGTGDSSYYLQKRWNQHDIDDDTPSTILLSSGELRRHHLREALQSKPRVLIIDNPFIGLDATARDQLRSTLATLAETGNVGIILVLSKCDEIPDFITHVVEVHDMKVMPRLTRQQFIDRQRPTPPRVLTDEKWNAVANLPTSTREAGSQVVKMNDVSIRYGNRTILRPLSWTVLCGEHWALTGHNGSGKSTLLSLVCADNPQGYACDISLFGQPRGTGETIWEIKKHIGYVSPEMHRAYQKDLPALRIVASGLKDSVGLYVKPTDDDLRQSLWWMRIFGIDALADRHFLHLSSGEQRLVLLARAFVKDPDLLILDEPLHGLDLTNRRLAKDVIEAFCSRKNKTLIMVTHYREEFLACIDRELNLNATEEK